MVTHMFSALFKTLLVWGEYQPYAFQYSLEIPLLQMGMLQPGDQAVQCNVLRCSERSSQEVIQHVMYNYVERTQNNILALLYSTTW